MPRFKQIKPICSILLFLLFCVSASAENAISRFLNIVFVGDSLTAGVQNIGLVKDQQETGYVAVLARQLGISLTQPLIAPPGMPPVLVVETPGLIPVLSVKSPGNLAYDVTHPQRLNPDKQPTNLAVPGFKVHDALTFKPTTLNVPPGPPDQWGNLVLGYPAPFLNGGPSRTMIEQAVMQKPLVAMVWLGNNDALVPALVGGGKKPDGTPVGIAGAITPPADFEKDYKAILDKLCGFKAITPDGTAGFCTSLTVVITATIPDLTTIPYFTPLNEVAQLFGVSTETLMSKTDLKTGDFVRRSALPVIQKILNGDKTASLASPCDSPIYALPVSKVPCVFSAADAAAVQTAVNAYNAAIARQSAAHHALVLDTYGFISRLHDQGYNIGSLRLTTSYLGGLFSLDGIHPSATGYAVLANFMIDKLNTLLHLDVVPEASVEAVWKSDPLRQYSVAR